MFLTLFASLSLLAYAAESEICQNLADLSCAPGAFKDGTGETTSESARLRQVSDFMKKIEEGLETDFSKVVNDPKEASFTQQAIQGLGLKEDPECKSKKRIEIASCRKKVVEGLTLTAYREIAGNELERPIDRLGNLKRLEAIQYGKTFRSVADKYHRQVGDSFWYGEIAKRVHDQIFPQLKNLLLERIEKMKLSAEDKKSLSDRIKAVELDQIRCESEIKNEAEEEYKPRMSQLVSPDLFFEKNKVRLCEGIFLQTSSEFTIASILGHEISHALGPCAIADGRPSTYQELVENHPLKSLISCITSPRSLGLKILTKPSPSKKPGGHVKDEEFCPARYVDEALSDWMMTEVLPMYVAKFKLSKEQYRVGYSNAHRTVCTSSEAEKKSDWGEEESEHPLTSDRINRMLLAHPKVREQMGCKSKLVAADYCDGERKPTAPSEAFETTPARSAASVRSGIRVDVLFGDRRTNFLLEKSTAGGILSFRNNQGRKRTQNLSAENYKYLSSRLTQKRETNLKEFCPRRYVEITNGTSKTLGCIGSGNAVARDLTKIVNLMAAAL